MKTDYKDIWPGNVTPKEERDLALRVGQLKYDLRNARTTIVTLEWITFIQLVVILSIVVVQCAS